MICTNAIVDLLNASRVDNSLPDHPHASRAPIGSSGSTRRLHIGAGC
jgi:hypothetical protein